MKKILSVLSLIAIVLLLNSCKKDSAGGYYVKVKKNGSWVEYPVTAGEFGPDLGTPTYTNLGVRGQTADSKEIFDLIIQVRSTTFPTGTYASDNPNYDVRIDLMVQSGTSVNYYDITDAPSQPACKFTVSISSITDTELTGSFTGNYLYNDFATVGDGLLPFTEGQFHVKRIR